MKNNELFAFTIHSSSEYLNKLRTVVWCATDKEHDEMTAIKQITSKYILTLVLASTTLVLSIFSIFKPNLYTDRINRITKYELLGQDLVTAIISVVFISIIILHDFRKVKVKTIWLGFLMYIFYIYAYFSFGGISSVFYLLYIGITGLSLFLFITIFLDTIQSNNLPIVKSNYPRNSTSFYLIFCVVIVGSREIIEIASKTIVNHNMINPFFAFYVLDLGIIFPLIIIAAILNIQKTSLGYLLTGIALIKIITILPAVIFNDVFHKIFVGQFIDLHFDIIAFVITITGMAFTNKYILEIN